MMKPFSRVYTVTFIAVVSLSILLGCTKVRNLAAYNRLYQKYVRENYTDLEYYQKLEKAKKHVEYFMPLMETTVDIPHDNSSFWRYLITLPIDSPEFDILKHYHIVLVFCGRFADL